MALLVCLSIFTWPLKEPQRLQLLAVLPDTFRNSGLATHNYPQTAKEARWFRFVTSPLAY